MKAYAKLGVSQTCAGASPLPDPRAHGSRLPNDQGTVDILGMTVRKSSRGWR